MLINFYRVMFVLRVSASAARTANAAVGGLRCPGEMPALLTMFFVKLLSLLSLLFIYSPLVGAFLYRTEDLPPRHCKMQNAGITQGGRINLILEVVCHFCWAALYGVVADVASLAKKLPH